MRGASVVFVIRDLLLTEARLSDRSLAVAGSCLWNICFCYVWFKTVRLSCFVFQPSFLLKVRRG